MKQLKASLEIRKKEDVHVKLTKDHVREIKKYLYMLDVIAGCPVETMDGNKPPEHIIFTQPGMRYSQVQACVFSLLEEEAFRELDVEEKNRITSHLMEEVRWLMREEMILLETQKKAGRKKNVFLLPCMTGECAMVIADLKPASCRIFAIHPSREAATAQYCFLVDEERCRQMEHRFGPITEKIILYRGDTRDFEGLQYKNIEEYLLQLS